MKRFQVVQGFQQDAVIGIAEVALLLGAGQFRDRAASQFLGAFGLWAGLRRPSQHSRSLEVSLGLGVRRRDRRLNGRDCLGDLADGDEQQTDVGLQDRLELDANEGRGRNQVVGRSLVLVEPRSR